MMHDHAFTPALSSEAWVRLCLARIDAREDSVRAWAWLDRAGAQAQARRLDREAPRGPLHGMPVGIKDVIDVHDMPTACNSPIHARHRAHRDAACVALLRQAGAVILGKTSTCEFAYAYPPATRHPQHPAHTPGGSSSGSAAAVADGMVPLSVATQTGGSIIRPAAFCGIVGYKPSFGRINRSGLSFLAESLDTLGAMARSVAEVALLAQAMAGRHAAPPPRGADTGREPPVIGVYRTPHWAVAEPAARQRLEACARYLADCGADVRDITLPAACDAAYDDQPTLMRYEGARALSDERLRFGPQLSDTLRSHLDSGWHTPAADYDAALARARCARHAFDACLAAAGVDLLLTLSAPGEAPAGIANSGSSLFNRNWSLLRVPCLTLPAGLGPRGLPLGVQLVGRHNGDEALLANAVWVEQQLRAFSPEPALSAAGRAS